MDGASAIKDCKKVCDSVRRAVLYNIFIEFGILMKLFSLIKMCSSDTFIAVQVGKCLFYIFPIKSGLKKGDTLSPLHVNFASECAIRIQLNQEGLKLNGTCQLLVCAGDANLSGKKHIP